MRAPVASTGIHFNLRMFLWTEYKYIHKYTRGMVAQPDMWLFIFYRKSKVSIN